MATKKSRKPAKKVKSLKAKSLNAKQARSVKGGKAKLQDISFVHNVDKASPVLLQN